MPSLNLFSMTTRMVVVVALTLFFAAAQLIAAPPAEAQPLLTLWSRGEAAAEWQRQLNSVREDNIAVDGIYGPVTRAATREFQRRAGITVDGIVGPETRGAMRDRIGGDVDDGDADGLLQRGDRGSDVLGLQSSLASLNYWVGPVDGIYGTLTRQAVLAFQKVNGLSPDGIVGPATRRALRDPRTPRVRSDREGLVMEVNKPRQILVSVWNGDIQHIWNTSTGTGEPYTYNGRRYIADTPEGRWEIYRQINGWRQSHLGRLYRPKYFHTDGIAIHGYPRVPAHPASHGCVRVTMAAMDYLWDELPVGTPVWVY